MPRATPLTALALALTLTLASTPALARQRNPRKSSNSPPPPPPSAPDSANDVETWAYQPKTGYSPCTWTGYDSTSLTCKDGGDNGVGSVLRVDPKTQSWQETCADECARLNQAGGECTAFLYRGPKFNVRQFQNTCSFRACTPAVDGTLVVVRNDVTTVTLVDGKTCLASAAPSTSPTTAFPTRSPTRGRTGAPTYRATTPRPTIASFPPSYTFAPTLPPSPPTTPRPTRDTSAPPPRDYPDPSLYDPSYFTLVRPDTSLCIMARVPIGANAITFGNWQGTQEQCLIMCQSDPACKGALFSPVLRRCVKATMVETYDDPASITAYQAQKWRAWVVGPGPARFYNNYCGGIVWSAACRLEAECGWNEGPKGYNDNKIYSRGYCGRTSCTPT